MRWQLLLVFILAFWCEQVQGNHNSQPTEKPTRKPTKSPTKSPIVLVTNCSSALNTHYVNPVNLTSASDSRTITVDTSEFEHAYIKYKMWDPPTASPKQIKVEVYGPYDLIVSQSTAGAINFTVSEPLTNQPSARPTNEPTVARTSQPTTPTNQPSSKPTAAPEDSACFPGDVEVRVRTESVHPSVVTKRMDALEVGDMVQVGEDAFSSVFFFTMQRRSAWSDMVHITTSDTAHRPLLLSPGHYLYVNGKLQEAQAVKVGDELVLGSGKRALVSRVAARRSKGLYNPHTLHGDIVVNDVIASTYTSAFDPVLAHSFLYPLRKAYR
jgi:hypothetical protein